METINSFWCRQSSKSEMVGSSDKIESNGSSLNVKGSSGSAGQTTSTSSTDGSSSTKKIENATSGSVKATFSFRKAGKMTRAHSLQSNPSLASSKIANGPPFRLAKAECNVLQSDLNQRLFEWNRQCEKNEEKSYREWLAGQQRFDILATKRREYRQALEECGAESTRVLHVVESMLQLLEGLNKMEESTVFKPEFNAFPGISQWNDMALAKAIGTCEQMEKHATLIGEEIRENSMDMITFGREPILEPYKRRRFNTKHDAPHRPRSHSHPHRFNDPENEFAMKERAFARLVSLSDGTRPKWTSKTDMIIRDEYEQKNRHKQHLRSNASGGKSMETRQIPLGDHPIERLAQIIEVKKQ